MHNDSSVSIFHQTEMYDRCYSSAYHRARDELIITNNVNKTPRNTVSVSFGVILHVPVH